MLRWIFFTLLAANCLPAIFAGNAQPGAWAPIQESQVGAGSPGEGLFLLNGERSVAAGPVLALNDRELVGEASGQTHCFLIGPLVSMSVAESIAVELEQAGANIGRHWREVDAGSDYWVYLPSMPSTRATTRTLQELQANDIDGFIFAEGELEGAIALGAYTDKQQAESHRENYARLGYNPKIREIGRVAREYWLSSARQLDPEILQELMQVPGIQSMPQKNSRKPCKTVASAMQFQ